MMLAQFWKDRSGTIAPAVAGIMIPVMGLIGAAVDYSRANGMRASLQSALDSTSLAMSQSAAGSSSQALQTNAQAYFNAVFNRTDAQNLSFNVSYSTSTAGNQVVVTASANIKTMFLDIAGIGIPSLAVSASSTSLWGTQRLRVALALDNTGSMSDSGKITALKTATHNLLTTLQNAAQQDGNVYVSIIPFSKDVNVDPANYNQSWVDFTAWDQANGTCNISGHSSQSSCLAASGTCSNHSYTSQSNCTSHHATWTAAAWTPASHSTWNGCVMDRDQNYDEKNTTPTTSNTSTLFPAEQYSSCPVATLAQTYNWSTLSSKVDAMTPNGNTNQGIGLALAWQTLTPGSPYNPPAKDPNYVYQDVLIILSDGLNTQNRYSSSASAIDTRQRTTCDNIKAANVVIYAVQVNTGGDATSSVLQYCASDASKFFMLTSSTQIITTFSAIGTNLAKLHISS